MFHRYRLMMNERQIEIIVALGAGMAVTTWANWLGATPAISALAGYVTLNMTCPPAKKP